VQTLFLPGDRPYRASDGEGEVVSDLDFDVMNLDFTPVGRRETLHP
jgi:hypothetical protein